MPPDESHMPPGWEYNPSAWSQRIPIVIIAVVGFGIATYLAMYQLDLVKLVWEPFFGDGSTIILNSKISHILPIPDAALGAFGYLLDAVTGVIGGTHRWKKVPWIVVAFGIAVGPLGIISVMLVVFQPVLFSAWCTLCLGSAVISVVMIGPALDEVLASLQFLKKAHKQQSISTWKVFWGSQSEIEKVI